MRWLGSEFRDVAGIYVRQFVDADEAFDPLATPVRIDSEVAGPDVSAGRLSRVCVLLSNADPHHQAHRDVRLPDSKTSARYPTQPGDASPVPTNVSFGTWALTLNVG
jgi:hypothetical protein